MSDKPAVRPEVTVVHTSDVHVAEGPAGAAHLDRVLKAADSVAADIVLLAGDTFENHRLPDALLEEVAALVAAVARPVVLLPGNHDPIVGDAVYHRPALAAAANLHVLGVTHEEALLFPALDLEIAGRAHRDYRDMIPFEGFRPKRARWRIAVAHGHYEPVPDRSVRARPAWLIGDDEIVATGADYVALGHWNRAIKVGTGAAAAYYSGSPDYAGTVNVVRFTPDGDVVVTAAPLDPA
ncbi:MAG: metallophosphoesterase family protein [Candidatus Eiseniibacteriota bacterium]